MKLFRNTLIFYSNLVKLHNKSSYTLLQIKNNVLYNLRKNNIEENTNWT